MIKLEKDSAGNFRVKLSDDSLKIGALIAILNVFYISSFVVPIILLPTVMSNGMSFWYWLIFAVCFLAFITFFWLNKTVAFLFRLFKI